MHRNEITSTSEPWLQIEPQHSWHGDAIIQGNESGLRKLAAALLKACESFGASSSADCKDVCASDGEVYSIIVLREEKPSSFRDPFYTINVECHHPDHHKHSRSAAEQNIKERT